MKRITVVATDKVLYDRREIQPGEFFECEEKDIIPLKLCGKIRDATPEDEQAAKKKRYNRRDLRASA